MSCCAVNVSSKLIMKSRIPSKVCPKHLLLHYYPPLCYMFSLILPISWFLVKALWKPTWSWLLPCKSTHLRLSCISNLMYIALQSPLERISHLQYFLFSLDLVHLDREQLWTFQQEDWLWKQVELVFFLLVGYLVMLIHVCKVLSMPTCFNMLWRSFILLSCLEEQCINSTLHSLDIHTM